MPSLGSLWYQVMLKDMTDADLQKINAKLKNLGVEVDTSKIRQSIEASVGATPFNATVSFGNARASLDAVFANKKYDVHVEAIASKLHESIKSALAGWRGAETSILPKKKELRKAVSDALLSAGFEINVGKVKGLNATINNALGSAHTLNVAVDPKKLADAIDKAVKSYKSGTKIPLEAKEKVLHDSIRKALKSEKFPIKVIVDKAEAQDAVRQALQAAGLQNTGFTASDKRAWDAQSRRMEAQARAAAASALAQRRLAGAHNQAANTADNHTRATVSLNSALKGNLTITKELGGAIGTAYSVVALKNFLTKVVEIGGELEKQKLAMNAILDNEGFANTISSQINTLAVKSPFGVMELNQYAKQLTAFQIPYNELYDTMKRMADVSAAVGVDMGRIILAYGQVRAAKFLKGTELRQFTEANIPMIDMLAKRFTKLRGEMVSAGDIMDMISKKEISFEDVKAVLWELTGDGGKFHNMQEVLSESVQAKWKNLADAIDLMFADIAKDTSGPLKGLAEILTELTQRWSTVAAVMEAAAIAFGVTKVAAFLTARSLTATGTAALKSAANTALLERRAANLATSYRSLTVEERKTLQTSIGYWWNQKSMLASLTKEQFKNLAATGQITKAEWERMIALNRLSKEQKYILNNLGILTTAEQNQIQVLQGWRKWTLGVGNAMRGLGRAMVSLLANPWTIAMAAIGTVVSLWQKNSQEMAKAKEMADNVATSASEGFGNLKKELENFMPAEGLTDVQLTQGIEQMQQLIKDYSPTPIKDINEALVAQDGHIRTLVEQYEILRERISGLKDAYYNLDHNYIGESIEGALKATDGGNWFTQLFDDNLAENAKDLTNALGRVTSRIAESFREHSTDLKKAINAALLDDAKFKKATANLVSYDEKLRFLAENADKYQKAVNRFNFEQTRNGYQYELIDHFSNAKQIKAAQDELLRDTDKFIKDYNSRLRQMGINPSAMTEQQKTEVAIAMKSMLAQLEDAGEEAKAVIAQQLEKVYGMAGMILEDKVSPILAESFAEIARNSNDKAVQEAVLIWQTQGYTGLSAAQKKLMENLFEEAKTKSRSGIEAIVGDMDAYLAAHPGQYDIVMRFVTESFNKEMPQDLRNALLARGGSFHGSKGAARLMKSWFQPGTQFEHRNAAQQSLQEAQSNLDAFTTEADKLTPKYKEAVQKLAEVKEALKFLGWTDLETKDQKSNKHGKSGSRSQEDPLAESLKQRFKDIKDAWSEFQKWSKTEGREAAAKRIGESGLFSTLSADKIPQTVEQYRALVVELENELRKAGVKGSARESLLNDLLKQLLGIDKTVVDEQLKLALDKVSKEAERQLADWNLFDKIRKATGNQDLAMSIAFGMNADVTTDYPTMIKQQLQKTVDAAESALSKVKPKKGESPYEVQGYNYDKLKKLYDARETDEGMQAWMAVPQKIREAWEKANDDILKYFDQQKDAIADILSEYQSLQDKLTKIDADRDRKIKTVRESDMSDADKAKYAQRINVEADYQKFTQSNEYLQFFAGVYALTEQEATRIGDLIEQNLNRRLQAGTISAEDYYKEIERVRQQLDKLRNVKSDALTFMTGGVKGLTQKKQEENDAKRLETIQKIKDLEEKLAEQKAAVKGIDDVNGHAAVMQTEAQLMTAKEELSIQDKIRDKLIQNQKNWQNILDVANIASNIAGGLSDAFNSIKDMADAFGVDTESGAWGDIEAVMDTLTAVTGGVQKVVQSAMSGDIGGVLAGVVSTVTTPFTIWSKLHDKKLQKLIERSKEEAQIMQNQYDILEKRMANFLGNAADMNTGVLGGGYGKQRELMQGQLRELQKQRQAEIDKKKTDKSVVEDYNKQIEEMKISIRDFAQEAAKDLYSIDLNGWAEQLGDSLVDAFAAGEDAAEAFDKTVGDIMRDVTSKMISQDILAPMFGDLRNFLFGENGMSGAFGADFKLDASEVAAMKEYLDKIKNQGIPAAEELFNAINDATGGMLDDTEKAKSGLSAGIQSVTEDTADLLASYVNAIRASVALNEGRWERLLGESLPQIGVIAQSQLDAQKQIAENTLRTAKATEAIVKSNDDISRLLTRVSQGGAKWHI